MNIMLKVARIHVVDRITAFLLPWGVLALSFAVNITIHAMIPNSPDGGSVAGGVVALYIFLCVVGAVSVTRSLPFALTLGLSRKTYFLGTVTYVLALAAVYAAALTVLRVVERAAGGWGVNMRFFRLPWLLDGPLAQTWATSFVLLSLFFVYGLWLGLVHRRWGVPGMVAFVAAQVILVLGFIAITTLTDSWTGVGSFFLTLGALGVTGVLALLVAALTAGGFNTMRRVTV